MAKSFSSVKAFAAHLLSRTAVVEVELHEGMKTVTKVIAKTARRELGHYQEAIGPFDAWAELAETTKLDRVAQGYTENDPLLRSGELRDSIGSDVKGLTGVVGSTKDEAVYMELGTTKAPPRPFLGPAVLHNEEKIKRILGGAVVTGILGKGVISDTEMTSAIVGGDD